MIFRFAPIFLLLLWTIDVPARAMTEQQCISNHCIQIGINENHVNAQDSFLQIYINDGLVKIIGDPKDQIKIHNLQSQVTQYLRSINKKEQREISDREALTRAETYIKELLRKLLELENNIAKFNKQGELISQLLDAKSQFDIPRIKQLLKQKQKLDDENAAETAFELASLQELDLEYAQAYENYQKAAYLQKGNSKYLNAAGLIALELEDATRAIVFFTQVFEIDSKTLGSQHPDLIVDLNSLGLAWHAKGNYDKAIDYYEQALASALKIFNEDHSHLAAYRNNLGITWHAKG